MRVAEAGLVKAVGDAPFAALVGLFAQESMHELQMRQALLGRAGQEGVEFTFSMMASSFAIASGRDRRARAGTAP